MKTGTAHACIQPARHMDASKRPPGAILTPPRDASGRLPRLPGCVRLAAASQATIGSGGLLGFALMLLYTGVMTVLSARPVFSWYLSRVGFHTGPSTLFLASLLLQAVLSMLLGAGALWWGARFLDKR